MPSTPSTPSGPQTPPVVDLSAVRIIAGAEQTDTILTVSYAALQYRYGVNRAFVVTGNRLAMRELGVGQRIGDRIEVVSGLKPGERIALTDVDTLTDGAAVTVTP